MAGKVTTQLVIEGKNNTERAVKQATEQLSLLNQSVDSLNGKLSNIAGAFVAAFTVSSISALVSKVGEVSAEISRMSQLSGVTVERFQALAFGAKSVGIQSDKLGDIYKDVQDKVGDFLSTGGGELQDFFTKIAPQVGVTAEQFRSLSGPDALQLYVSSLEKANLSQSQMTFYLEAIANDASLLLPLLHNNGEGFRALGEQAQNLGLILSSDQIAAGNQLANSLSTMTALSDNLEQRLGTGLAPTISSFSGLWQDFAKDTRGASEAAGAFGAMLKLIASLGIGVYSVFKGVGSMIGGFAASVVALLTGDFKGAFQIASEAGSDFLGSYAEGIDRISKLWSGEYQKAGEDAAQVQAKIRDSFGQTQRTMSTYAGVAQTTLTKVKDIQTATVAALQKAITQQQALESEATSKLKTLKDQQLDIYKKYQDRIKAFSGQPAQQETPATYQAASDLKVQARAAAASGDVEKTAKLADQAYEVLQKMKEAGQSTFGLEGFVKELQGIEVTANQNAQAAATQKASGYQATIDDLKTKLAELQKVSVDVTLNPTAVSALQTQMTALAAQLKSQFTIPVTLTPTTTATTTTTTTPAVLPGFAGGGQLRGPGTGTSDSILMWGSNGEYMIKAAAVKHYGTGLFDLLNGMKLPGFAEGGLVASASSIGGNAQAGRPLTINLPGYGAAHLSGPASVVDGLEQHFRTLALQKGSTRRKGRS